MVPAPSIVLSVLVSAKPPPDCWMMAAPPPAATFICTVPVPDSVVLPMMSRSVLLPLPLLSVIRPGLAIVP